LAVPSQTWLRAKFIADAMRGSSASRQFADGTGSWFPSLSTTLSSAIGSQKVPFAANEAKAAAIVSGAIASLPRTLAGYAL
jgi:hypothetical protein